MKQLDENRPSGQAVEAKSSKRSFLRSLLPNKSSSTLSANEESLSTQQKHSKPKEKGTVGRTGSYVREKQLKTTNGEEQQDPLVKETLELFSALKSSGHTSKSSKRKESRPQTSKNLPSNPQPEAVASSTSRPIQWVVPDYINENKSPPEISNNHGKKEMRKRMDEEQPKKGSGGIAQVVETKTVPKKSSSHKLPKQRNVNTEICTIPNQEDSYRTSYQRSSSANINHKKIRPKKVLTIESPTRRRNRKLVHLVVELRKSCDHYRREIKRVKDEEMGEVLQLQSENENLNMELYNLNQDVEGWKARCRKQENQNTSLMKVKTLTKKNNELTEDMDVLKSVINRLNKEMSFYQDKLRIQKQYLPNQIPRYSTSSSSCDKAEDFQSEESSNGNHEENESGILKEPTKKLFPLLVAYDEVIKEKNSLIKNHEETLESFKTQCQEVVQENQDLHEIISDRKEKGRVSIQEWQFLHANSIIVLEENDLLHEQISVLKQTESMMMTNHQDRVSKLKTKISLLEEEKSRLKSAAIKTETHCKMLIDQHTKLADIMEKRIPLEQHEASVLECKKLFEELKISYGDERTVLMDKLSSAEKERDRLASELCELEAENGRIQSNIKTCEDALAVNAAQFREVYNRMIVATNARDTTTSAMEEMMELSQRVVSERENTEQLLYEQRSLNEKLILLREKECELIAELHSKIKDMEDVHQKELEKLIFRIKELERIISGIGESNKQEMVHLEELIQEKEKRIEHLETEKGQLQLDLETVWKTTTSTMQDLRNKP